MKITPMLDDRYDVSHHPVVIRITHQRQRRFIPTGFKIEKKYWNGKEVYRHPEAAIINSRITAIIDQAKQYYAQCMLHGKPVNLSFITQSSEARSLNQFLQHRAKMYEKKGQHTMAGRTLHIDLEWKQCFGREVTFEEISIDMLNDYEAWLIDQKNNPNTRIKKFRSLGQWFDEGNKAADKVLPNPFKNYKIKPKPVSKEKLSEEDIRLIEHLSIQPGPVNDARNLYLFSNYTRGQRFEVCISCKRSQIKKGRIIFQANKGGKHISVKIHARLKSILDQYNGKGFIFPYVNELPDDPREYKKVMDVLNVQVNRELKVVAALAGIAPFTFHQARHTFAYHLKKTTDSIHVIKDALAHSSSQTTEIYLKTLDDTVLDKEMEKLYGS